MLDSNHLSPRGKRNLNKLPGFTSAGVQTFPFLAQQGMSWNELGGPLKGNHQWQVGWFLGVGFHNSHSLHLSRTSNTRVSNIGVLLGELDGPVDDSTTRQTRNRTPSIVRPKPPKSKGTPKVSKNHNPGLQKMGCGSTPVGLQTRGASSHVAWLVENKGVSPKKTKQKKGRLLLGKEKKTQRKWAQKMGPPAPRFQLGSRPRRQAPHGRPGARQVLGEGAVEEVGVHPEALQAAPGPPGRLPRRHK